MADEKLLGNYEMLWDCPFCGATKLLGITHRHCPNCGAEQDQTKRYFPSDADKVAVKDDVYAGTDKVCGSCNAPNGAKAEFCMKCGAPLDAAAAAKKRSQQVVAAGTAFAADDAKKAEAELGLKGKPATQTVAPKKRSFVWLYIVLAVVGLCFLIWFMCIRKKSADFVVEGQHWKKTVAIEEWKLATHEQWQDQLPTGAQNLSCHDKQYSSHKEKQGQDCQNVRTDNGNGTFSESQKCTDHMVDVPDNKPWCSYQVYEWTQVDQQATSADDGQEPQCPDTKLPPNPAQVPGARRADACKDEFDVDVYDKKNNQRATCAVDKKVWQKLTRGTAAKGEERARSDEIVCDTVGPK